MPDAIRQGPIAPGGAPIGTTTTTTTTTVTAAHRTIASPRADWLALHSEDILDPAQPIVDAHHHLWALPGATYLRPQLLEDLDSGHDIRATVFVDCHSHYLSSGPAALRPTGETAFVVAQAPADDATRGGLCAAIVGWADLMLGEQVSPVLEAHMQAGQGRFRGIRSRPTWHDDAEVHPSREGSAGLLREPALQRGARALGAMGLSLDLWIYHTQLDDVAHLAAHCPDTTLVLNHCGGPLGNGPFTHRRAEVFDDWRQRIRSLASHPQVHIKLGGLAMPRMGFGLELAQRPLDSSALAAAWAPYFETCIEAFGTQRCMFESNFPVDKTGCSYAVLWNAFKRVAAGCSASERTDLFMRTATRTYGMAQR
ncbi:amidohydrolase family protein [Variovorax sp. H27-G14]|uniref:amidohydrolase family protein n=1 Tax=Variovorax sp. H27-G14 TaxID=3111914 RepID=UPI0038FC94B9